VVPARSASSFLGQLPLLLPAARLHHCESVGQSLQAAKLS
jgi:hypothetical protein